MVNQAARPNVTGKQLNGRKNSLLLVVSGEYFQDLISTLKQATLHSLVSKVKYEVKQSLNACRSSSSSHCQSM